MSIKIIGNKITNCGTAIKVNDELGTSDILIENNEMKNNLMDISMDLTHESRVEIINNKLMDAKVESISISYKTCSLAKDFEDERLNGDDIKLIKKHLESLSKITDSTTLRERLIEISSNIGNNLVSNIIVSTILSSIGL